MKNRNKNNVRSLREHSSAPRGATRRKRRTEGLERDRESERWRRATPIPLDTNDNAESRATTEKSAARENVRNIYEFIRERERANASEIFPSRQHLIVLPFSWLCADDSLLVPTRRALDP